MRIYKKQIRPLRSIGEQTITLSIRERRQSFIARGGREASGIRCLAIRKQGELVHAQTLDEHNIVVSETYKFDDAYHIFYVSSFTEKGWFDIEDEEELETIRGYLRIRTQRRLQRHPWPRQVIGLTYTRWTQWRRYYKVKHELDDTDTIAVPEQ